MFDRQWCDCSRTCWRRRSERMRRDSGVRPPSRTSRNVCGFYDDTTVIWATRSCYTASVDWTSRRTLPVEHYYVICYGPHEMWWLIVTSRLASTNATYRSWATCWWPVYESTRFVDNIVYVCRVMWSKYRNSYWWTANQQKNLHLKPVFQMDVPYFIFKVSLEQPFGTTGCNVFVDFNFAVKQ